MSSVFAFQFVKYLVRRSSCASAGLRQAAMNARHHLEVDFFLALKILDNFEQVAGLRVAGGAQHPHQALGRVVRGFCKLGKTDGGG